MKKGMTLLALVLGIVMFSFANVSATLKSYNEVNKEVLLSSNFLFFNTGDIAKVQLKSDLVQQVGLGYQKVFEFEINSYREYKDFLKGFEIYNLKKGNKLENKKVDLKYLDYEIIKIPLTKEVCSETKNGTSCSQVETGEYGKKEVEVWKDLTSNDIKIENITISGWTDVKQGDYYEWIPNFAGVKVSEWATWSGNLSTGLVSYYKLDEPSGSTAYDSLFLNNATNSGALVNQSGKINTSYLYDGVGNVSTSNITSYSTETVSLWFKTNETSMGGTVNRRDLAIKGYAWDVNNLRWALQLNSSYYLLASDYSFDGTISQSTYTNNNLNNGSWYHVVAIFNQTHTILYLNGVQVNIAGGGNTHSMINTPLRIGNDLVAVNSRGFNGYIDEVGIWNRSLSATEISLLYNNGSGCQYGNESCYGPIDHPVITLNSPVNAYNSSTSSIIFNCSGTDETGLTYLNLSVDGDYIYNLTGSGTTNLTLVHSASLSEGTHNWTCTTSDGTNIVSAPARNLFIDLISPQITLNYPTSLIDYGKINTTLQLNITANDTHLDKVWYDYNGTNITLTGAISGIYNVSNITLSEKKNITIYANDTIGHLTTNTFNWDYKIFENGRTYNSSTFETKNETFVIDITSNNLTNAWLNYGGFDYPTTGTNIRTTTLPIPLVSASTNKIFYWILQYGNENITTYSSNQTIQSFLVNWTGTKQYVNITIKDEYDNSIINSTTMNTLFDYYIDKGGYTNQHQETYVRDGIYGFFSTPNILKWSADGRLYYYATGYQPRYYFIDDETYTNSSITQKTLYLLLQSDGILVRYKIYDSAGNLLDGVRITAYKIVGSSEILVEQVLTDDLGEGSLFLDPNYYHRIIITKGGCTTINKQRRITSSETTTEFMTCAGGGGGEEYNLTTFENLTISFSPTTNVLYSNTSQIFSFTSNEPNSLITSTNFILKHGGTNIFSLNGNNPNGETLSQLVNLSSYTGTLTAYGIVVINNQTKTFTKSYRVMDFSNPVYNGTTIADLINKLKNPNFGSDIGLDGGTRVFITFLILFGLIAMFGTQTIKDNSLMVVTLIGVYLFFMSYIGFLTIDSSPYEIINQYGIAIITTLFGFGSALIGRYM